MSETALLADHIDQQVEAILDVWRTTVARYGDVPDSGRLSHQDFLDHVPVLIERLTDRLRGRPASLVEASRCHGGCRWSQGYTITELVTEMSHLRSTLVRDTFTFGNDREFDHQQIETLVMTINNVIDEFLAESVQQYLESTKSHGRELIAEVEGRKNAAEIERIKQQALIDDLPVGVWVSQADGAFVSVNREAIRLQGSAGANSVGRNDGLNLTIQHQLFRPDGSAYQAGEFPIERALRGETVLREDHFWHTLEGGLFVTASAAPLKAEDGSIAGAVLVVQDITDRKVLEADLAASESRFRVIVEKSPVMIWRSDRHGRCDFFNETWLEFRGRRFDQEAGRGWIEGIHPDDSARRIETFRRAMEDFEPFEVVYRLQRFDGEPRWVTDQASPYYDGSGVFLGFLGSAIDITARIELEAKLEQQSQHKSRLMAALSHDARTPLNAVVLSARLLESQVKDQDDPEVKECLRTIRNAVRNVLDLLSDLLDLSRIDAGATLAELSRFTLRDTLAECLSSIEPQARAKGLDIEFDDDSIGQTRLNTDRAKFKQILSNLLSNALRYTEAGSIRLFASIDDQSVRIGVQDTGIGIAAQDQARIFDEFAVLEHPNRVRGEGTGLGLAICHRLANLLQGEIRLTSEPGRGSQFTLALPVSVITEETEPAATPSASPAGDSTGAILIAEDHADSRRTMAKVLRRLGYRVLEASNGHEVLSLVQTERPMVILMDVNMPEMDGVEATLALRRDPRFQDLPIFALTGDVSVINQSRISDAGVNGFLEKPVTWEKLEAALEQLTGKAS